MSACFCTGACRNGGGCSAVRRDVMPPQCPRPFGTPPLPKTAPLPVIPPLPEEPSDGAIAVCGACGLRIFPVMAYVCGNPRCGVFPRVTC